MDALFFCSLIIDFYLATLHVTIVVFFHKFFSESFPSGKSLKKMDASFRGFDNRTSGISFV